VNRRTEWKIQVKKNTKREARSQATGVCYVIIRSIPERKSRRFILFHFTLPFDTGRTFTNAAAAFSSATTSLCQLKFFIQINRQLSNKWITRRHQRFRAIGPLRQIKFFRQTIDDSQRVIKVLLISEPFVLNGHMSPCSVMPDGSSLAQVSQSLLFFIFISLLYNRIVPLAEFKVHLFVNHMTRTDQLQLISYSRCLFFSLTQIVSLNLGFIIDRMKNFHSHRATFLAINHYKKFQKNT